MSTLSSGISEPCSPNHSANRGPSVHALKTSSRGASKTRTIRIPSASLCAETTPSGGVASLILGSPLDRSQVLLQAVEVRLPEPPILAQPLRGVTQRPCAQAGRAVLRRSPPGDEPGALQHLEVLGHGLQAHRERLGELVDGRLALRQPL